MAVRFSRVAVLGTGLVGGSFALALRKLRPRPRVVGWDKPEVLRVAKKRGAIDKAEPNLARAVAGADLVYVALPVGATLELLPQIARAASAKALVSDASTDAVPAALGSTVPLAAKEPAEATELALDIRPPATLTAKNPNWPKTRWANLPAT